MVELLGGQTLSGEKIRLKAQLDKDAERRLKLIAENDKLENSVLDASCGVYQSRYGMIAWVFIFPPSAPGGKLQFDDVGRSLQLSGVTTGIDSNAIVQLVKDDTYFKLIPIAIGTPVTPGKDGRILEHFPHEVTNEIKVDEKGVADYRSRSYVQTICEEEIICDIIPPEDGKAGVRVDGKIIDPKRTHPARVPMGKNTRVAENGKHLVAAIDGHLVYVNGQYVVRPLLEIKGDVDYSTGNIDYRGDVHIHGDVRENFFVRATGTITIEGTVEAANIEAGGDLIVSSGVLGDNRATIKSAGCIRVKYLESCVAYAAKEIFADCIMTAHVYSDEAICVTTGRGTVIGGSLTAAHTIKAKMLGSQANTRTAVTLGILPYSQEKMHNDRTDLKAIRAEMKELEYTIEELERQQGMEGMGEKLAKSRLRRNVLLMKESQLMKHQDAEQVIVPDLEKCRLECEVVYPITTVKIGDDLWRADQTTKRCTLCFDKDTGTIVER
jgi:uncharacterized protein (DUF342 family)